MEVKEYTKRPLTVGAFRFDAEAATINSVVGHHTGLCIAEINGVRFECVRSSRHWYVYNPGRGPSRLEQMQKVNDGDYIIIAPTGCRYPVSAEMFHRNYAERVVEPAPEHEDHDWHHPVIHAHAHDDRR